MTKVGLIGLGYWGPNHARVLNQTSKCEFTAVCDLDPRRLEKIQRQYPSLKGYRRTEDLLNSDVDAVVIATPISTHYELARQALHSGKHVFVEKPLADNSARARALVDLAEINDRRLMTGHTFVYSPPVVKVKELIDAGALGDLHYLSFSRVNLGLYQKDVDVVWDLAVHDISILLYWLGEIPVSDLTYYSVPALLHYEDRNSMAHSIESRVPFLDHELAEFLVNCPTSLKLRHGWSKWILREGMKGVLPEKVRLRRDKMWFPAPQSKWLRNGLRAETEKVFASPDLRMSRFLAQKNVVDEFGKFFANAPGALSDASLFRVLSLERWAAVFDVS